MKTYNEDFSRLFHEIADLMAVIGENDFKIRAYRNTARRLEEEIPQLTKKDITIDALKKIPGVGDALAGKMTEYVATGKITYLERLRKQIPKAVRDLLDIPHLGPKRVHGLFINLGIQSKKDLKKAAKEGRIAELPGFGDKLTKQILGAMQTGQQKKKRHKRTDVEPIAKKLTALLKKIPGVKSVDIAGSYRRDAPTVGDVDILVCGKPVAHEAEAKITKSFSNLVPLASGETKVAFVLFPENLQIDIRFVPEESYGAALLYFTGSKDFNVKMRKTAIAKGYLLNEYGLFKAGEYKAGKTEKEVFKMLSMKDVLPSNRK